MTSSDLTSSDQTSTNSTPIVAAYFPDLCTYGVAARAIVQTACGNDASKLMSLNTRFSSPVFPGETLIVEMWRDGSKGVRFRAKVAERDIVVLSHGYAGIKP